MRSITKCQQTDTANIVQSMSEDQRQTRRHQQHPFAEREVGHIQHCLVAYYNSNQIFSGRMCSTSL